MPAKTTRVITVAGVLRREEMELVMNPHDAKAMEAASYLKGMVGGKIVALSMGPEIKLLPIISELYDPAFGGRFTPRIDVEGVDESVVLSDRRMAGADTVATAYAVSLGIKKVIDMNLEAIDGLIRLIEGGAEPTDVKGRALELYQQNLLPNRVFSQMPSVKNTIIEEYVSGSVSREKAVAALREARSSLEKFIVVAGYKTSDGETGSTAPQVAEGLTELYGWCIPHITYVHDFLVDPLELALTADRRIGRTVQRLRCSFPAVLTISPEYRPRPSVAAFSKHVRANNYREKMKKTFVWNAEAIGADPSRLGLAGSPTLVGPGVEIARPPIQKMMNRSVIFLQRVDAFEWNGGKFGPFEKGDALGSLPDDLRKQLMERGLARLFTADDLVQELFGSLMVAARTVYQQTAEQARRRSGT